MRKIPTLFVRNPDDLAHVLPEVNPGCEWVTDGEGTATRKYDGTCVMREADGRWYARREVKPGKKPPANFVAVATDAVTGKTVGWESIGQSAFVKFHTEAVAARDFWESGTYELCGPKINGNPEGFTGHVLIQHEYAEDLEGVPRDFDGLAAWMAETDFEGVVWHHPDGRMAKLKRKDFIRPTTSEEPS